MEVDRKGHLVELQSIRGIASSMVLLGHSGSFFATHSWLHYVWDALFNGRAAVVTFFVLSGFVLTRMLDNKPVHVSVILLFYLRRAFRIYPALWVATAFGLAAIIIFHHAGTYPLTDFIQYHFGSHRLTPLTTLLSFAGLCAWVLPQVWTIAIELAGSLVMPVFASLVLRRIRWFWPVLLVLVALGVAIGPRSPYEVLLYLPAFLIGAGIYALPGQWRSRLRNIPEAGKVVVVIVSVTCLVLFRACFDLPFGDPWLAMVEMISSASLIAMVVHSGIDGSVLRGREIVWLGDISYSLFLFHIPIWLLLSTATLVTAAYFNIEIVGIVANTVNAILTFGITMVVANWSYRSLEMPGSDIGRKVVAYLKSRYAAVPI